eukprot:CAMPEP_0206134758 /NCGR_PEP_ID=MMETSP1473-20131121/191_1 /ASSEMBLY_ACC=CAM_ASM_001109 /TAXON_ID=1461547 /ORGANISM="Stichococcus sp, Strain RCC1054" /LENGTH=245 /DNA_ID=CAMNT_0053526379 /DNA_START=106 /DNA_END=843 /DNA_ORIENTATION=-
MGRALGYLAVAALAVATLAAAQTQDRANNVGTAQATSQSNQFLVPAGGCVTYNYTNSKSPGFNYTAYLGLAKLADGCETKDIQILKQYTAGACPDTRANNYAVASLGISNTCADPISEANQATCTNAFLKAPKEAYAASGIGAGNLVDSGNVCWKAPEMFYFVRNLCNTDITATIKLTTDIYTGDCKDASDSDDGGDDAGGPGSTDSSDGGLSTGAKVGIAIGVVGGVIIIAALAWFFCCQLRKQ